MTAVFVEGLEFHAFHGVTAEEKRVGQRLRVDVHLEVQSEAEATDSIGDTVDYASVATLVHEVSIRESFDTLERLGFVVGKEVLARFPRVHRFRGTFRKLKAPTPFAADAFGVTIERNR